MTIKNLSLQTIALHIGRKDYSKVLDISRTYNRAGYLTNPGISIFGDAFGGQKATVTIYPPLADSKLCVTPAESPPSPTSTEKLLSSIFVITNHLPLFGSFDLGYD